MIIITFNFPSPVSRTLKNATRDLLAPLQELASSFSTRMRGAGDAIRGWGGLPEKNQVLQEEVMLLRQQLMELDELREQNYLLRQKLGFQQRQDRHLIASTVLARDISGWWQTIRIQHHGSPLIQPDLAVINEQGLVGRVIEISSRTADVLLISDPACRVAVQIGDKGAFAILQGQGMSWRGRVLCKLTFINKNIKIQRGDEVFTSGLGGVFPKGIKVGSIETVEMDQNGLYQSAEVQPAVDLSQLEVIFIVAKEPEAR
ncbi:rod shape-determining protein MreC [Kiritimatiellota bacterium B12222]|nr:rod shape-determining protein MreC [Kiritimatiellota bacterium B12222]